LFNAVNHPNFNTDNLSDGQTPSTTSAGYSNGNANFGYYTGAADPREVEFALEYSW